MKSIYKYDIMTAQNGIIEAPITKVLYAGEQNQSIKVWAEVDTDAPVRKIQFIPIGTGWNLDNMIGDKSVLDTHKYLNTVILAGGSLVFHVYYADVVTKEARKTTRPEKKEAKAVADSPNATSARFSGTVTMINPSVLKQLI